MYNIFNTVDLL